MACPGNLLQVLADPYCVPHGSVNVSTHNCIPNPEELESLSDLRNKDKFSHSERFEVIYSTVPRFFFELEIDVVVWFSGAFDNDLANLARLDALRMVTSKLYPSLRMWVSVRVLIRIKVRSRHRA